MKKHWSDKLVDLNDTLGKYVSTSGPIGNEDPRDAEIATLKAAVAQALATANGHREYGDRMEEERDQARADLAATKAKLNHQQQNFIKLQKLYNGLLDVLSDHQCEDYELNTYKGCACCTKLRDRLLDFACTAEPVVKELKL